MVRIGIDTGGTFTDFVFSDEKGITTLKLPSTPQNPAISVLKGLETIQNQKSVIIHGTTVATNAFLQKQMAKSAFLCTEGFEHMLFIGRQNRINLFSFQVQKPTSIVPLSLCFGIGERTLPDGQILRSLEPGSLSGVIKELKKKKVQSVGIVFLHSYKNNINEKQVAKIMRESGFYVTASHEILPEYREYERAVVTILNSALKPIIADYISNLKGVLKKKGLFIMQSNGGMLSPERIMDEPVRTMISGPAGGVIAAKQFAGLKKVANVITLDMGGTSTDVSLIKDKELMMTRNGYIENLPLRLPLIDITTVGAGGGSIAEIDRGGVLRVGPRSAGADPGPACYGKSQYATVTDAFVVTGLIQPELFLGGKMKIYPRRSFEVVQKIANKIGKTLYKTAEGIILISVSTMERALRSVTLERGEDPRFYTLLPFGGAGGMVATLLADRLGINRILIPPFQGVFSALGMLEADFQKEFSKSFLRMYTSGSENELRNIFSEMTADAMKVLKEDGFSEKDSFIQREVEIRYKGQSYELTVPYNKDFIKKFHKKHNLLYSYFLSDKDCEIVNLRVLAIGSTKKLNLKKRKLLSGIPGVFDRKKIFFNGEFQSFHLYLRKDCFPGLQLQVPAIIISDDSTAVAEKNFKATVDEFSNIILIRQR